MKKYQNSFNIPTHFKTIQEKTSRGLTTQSSVAKLKQNILHVTNCWLYWHSRILSCQGCLFIFEIYFTNKIYFSFNFKVPVFILIHHKQVPENFFQTLYSCYICSQSLKNITILQFFRKYYRTKFCSIKFCYHLNIMENWKYSFNISAHF